jgi:hypothetical protein
MNFLLFVLEISLVVGGIALVPARSQLRICRPREIYNERERQNSLRPRNVRGFRPVGRYGFVK